VRAVDREVAQIAASDRAAVMVVGLADFRKGGFAAAI
jgi:hypothetical protein